MLNLSRLDQAFTDEVMAEPGGENLLLCYSCGTCMSTCLVKRYNDEFNPRRGTPDEHDVHQTTLGLNLYLHGNREKVQLNYLLRGADDGPPPANEFICQYQRFLW